MLLFYFLNVFAVFSVIIIKVLSYFYYPSIVLLCNCALLFSLCLCSLRLPVIIKVLSYLILSRRTLSWNCSLRNVGAVLSETVATVSLSTGSNRFSIQRPFFILPRSGGRRPVTAVRLTIISSCSAASLKSRLSTAD